MTRIRRYKQTNLISKISVDYNFVLTLNCIRYPDHPLVHKGIPWNPPKKTTFPPEFLNHFYTICIYTNLNYIAGIEIQNFCTVSKWRPNNQFSFRVISILAKIWKKHFPKGIFQWMQLSVSILNLNYNLNFINKNCKEITEKKVWPF